jgi:hypothetical protein
LTCSEKSELKKRGSPIFLDLTVWMAFRFASSKWRRYAIMSLIWCLRAARIIAAHSFAVTAIGFSHRTWMPALAARIEYSAWRLLGNAIYTASIAASHQIVILIIGCSVADTIFFAENGKLFGVARNESRYCGITVGVFERRQHRDLRNMT